MELPSFAWVENIFDAPGISTGGDLESVAAGKARVIFTSNLDPKRLLTYQGNSQRPPIEVYATVDSDGQVVDKNGFAPRLLANDNDLSVNDIQWTRAVKVPAPGGTLELYPLTFSAPVDGDSVGPTTADIVPPTDPDPDDDAEVLDGGEL